MRLLVLGCAQFGKGYGFYVKTPQISSGELSKILEFAASNDVNELDLAQNYEGVVENLAEQSSIGAFQLGTKIKYSQSSELEITNLLRTNLKAFGVGYFESILIHNWAQLNKAERNQALAYLSNLRTEGITRSIGISVYETKELLELDAKIDIVQAPLSYFNTKFLHDENAVQLKNQGVIFVARSIFHQGTLLNPDALPTEFTAFIDEFEDFCARHNYSHLQAALSVFDTQSVFSKLVIGVAECNQFEQIVKCEFEAPKSLQAEIPLHFPDQLSDPRQWVAK
jgi:aryl-alcohol dehydrogenase-like predicted oxidoreductase